MVHLLFVSRLKINRLVSQDNDNNRLLILDADTISSIELAVRHLDRLSKTFHEICTELTTQILLLTGRIYH